MGDLFLKILNMSITAGWLILAVLCIRLLFRRMPKWVNCLLWGAVALRLVCPFSPESRFSLLPSAEPVRYSTIVDGELQSQIPSIDSRLTIVKNTINPLLTKTFAHDGTESAPPLLTAANAAGIVWVCGMVLLLICAVVSMIRLHRLVEEAVRIRDNIYICDAVKSPFILGIARPRIYLSSALSGQETEYIIAHESAHLKRKDHWWKPLGYLLLSVHWFNPLCWAAYAMLCRDIELACDEKVARDMTFGEKKEYSRILLACARQRSLVMACPLAFGEVGVKERVKSVLHYKKPAVWILATTATVCVILAVCFLTNPTKEYQIRITIPAGSTEPFCYSDAEISPKSRTLTLYAGEGLGDTEVRLLPIEVREENAYDESPYMTPGWPVKMDAEKGAWFKIGVNVQNPTDEDIDVYVSVSNVEVRIASRTDENDRQETEMVSGREEDYIMLPEDSPDAAQQLSREEVAQWEDFSDMQVSNLLTGSGFAVLSGENAAVLRTILESEEWEEGLGRCYNDYEIVFDGNTVRYHSECGTFNDSVHNRLILLSEEDRAEVNEILEKYVPAQTAGTQAEQNSIQDIVLYEQPETDKVCIRVQPSMLREQNFYYYIPVDKDQEWLSARVEALDLTGEPGNRRLEGLKENGWQISYRGMEIRTFEGGYLYYSYDDGEKGLMECLIEEPKLCDYIQIMLTEEIGYRKYDVFNIKKIVSARLDVSFPYEGGQLYSQTITDADALEQFAEWFGGAEYISPGLDCGNRQACLELALANGETVKLSMATDSCPVFFLDGVSYDYRPVPDWDNSGFYRYFDEIPAMHD